MDQATFNSLYESLCNYYGKNVNKGQQANWHTEFSGVYDFVLLKAIDAVKHNTSNNNFPSPNLVWKAIHEIKAEDWNKKKLREQQEAHNFFREDNKSGVALSAITLINARLSDKLSTAQLVEQMYLEEKTYPGIGWQENAEALNAFLDYYHEPNEDIRKLKKTEMDRLDKICDAIQ